LSHKYEKEKGGEENHSSEIEEIKNGEVVEKSLWSPHPNMGQRRAREM